MDSKYTKKSFQIKKNNNGVFFHIHHTIQNDKGEVRRVRFAQVCFSDSNEFIVAVDHRGNIFIFNLVSAKFWVIENHVPKCSVVKFIPGRNDRTVFGTKDGNLFVIDINIGENIINLSPHLTPIFDLSFSSIPGNMLLSITKIEAKLFDIDSFELRHTLDYSDNSLFAIRVSFIPLTDKILSCFSDDTIHVWNQNNMQLFKQMHPFKIVEKYLKKTSMEDLDLLENDDEILWMPSSRANDYTEGRIKSISITENGKFICISSADNLLIIMSVVTWEVYKIINLLNSFRIKQATFIPQINSDFKYLTILSSVGDLFLINADNLNMKTIIQKHNGYKISVSKNGQMLAIILNSGEIFIQNMNFYWNRMEIYHKSLNELKDGKENNEYLLEKVFQEIKETLPRTRLLSILKQFGEYPTRYRQIIWRSLLELPQNNEAFTELLKKGNHPCVINYDKEFPLRDLSAARNLKKIVSSLAFWSRIFGQHNFISSFVFPFLKIYQNDLISCFETIATILLNQCQLWFEFSPLEPLNYLGMIENILFHFDSTLIVFYMRKKVTSKIYGWYLMENNFSEVLDEKQWLQLWDNIVSNQPYFLLFTIVAYNILQKSVIMRLETIKSIEEFFHDQNNIDMKRLISKTYELMENCPDNLHPKRYMKNFQPLNKIQYQKFENFPKMLINLKNNEMKKLKDEQEILEIKMRQLEKMEKKLSDNLEDELKIKEHENRMREVEKLYEEALLREEERISYQRKLLLLYQRQIREREYQILDESRKNIVKKNILSKESELDSLLKTLERNRIREDTDILVAEENFKSREMEFLNKKCELNQKFMDEQTLSKKYKYTLKQLEMERTKLHNELSLMKEGSSPMVTKENQQDIMEKIGVIEELLNDIQIEFTKVIANKYCRKEKVEKVKDLENGTNFLEQEVKKLLQGTK